MGELKWRKATRSDANGGACVEVATLNRNETQLPTSSTRYDLDETKRSSAHGS